MTRTKKQTLVLKQALHNLAAVPDQVARGLHQYSSGINVGQFQAAIRFLADSKDFFEVDSATTNLIAELSNKKPGEL